MTNKVIISGGLGNQMFQYAFALALRGKGYSVKIDTSLYNLVRMHNGYELYRVFGITEDVIDRKGIHLYFLRLLLKLKPSCLIKVDTIKYDPNNLMTERHYFSGVWLSANYFDSIKTDVRDSFKFKSIDQRNRKIAVDMKALNSVSIHIRRGDYVSWGISLLGYQYYKSAIELINAKVDNPKYYIFSDDIVSENSEYKTAHIGDTRVAHIIYEAKLLKKAASL